MGFDMDKYGGNYNDADGNEKTYPKVNDFPAGEYNMEMQDVMFLETKAGNGMIKLLMKVMDGEYSNSNAECVIVLKPNEENELSYQSLARISNVSELQIEKSEWYEGSEKMDVLSDMSFTATFVRSKSGFPIWNFQEKLSGGSSTSDGSEFDNAPDDNEPDINLDDDDPFKEDF